MFVLSVDVTSQSTCLCKDGANTSWILCELMCLAQEHNQAPVGIICLIELRFNIPVNNFSVMLGQSHCFLEVNQYFGELTCLAEGHNSAASGDQTKDLSFQSLMLYHYATALP